ncbi:ribosomal protection-like ABC-F family protein [Marininema halotolerans]|uniref:ATPase components of ABC transporters with duplicated ATPase domains n=1 Tax=Marininema halotolerans TaxID=1155944 RepID=A0A1I6PP11_9BACL|nr:ABC-F type ribosomal protection protein [Marininema halotolerans]SFS41785.1 ATPase components of ABC transporters with duplicated ATPase domains [Marininema halotolerans]
MFVVKAQDLSKECNGITVVKDANLEIQAGEKVALIGANGVGKTSLLRLLMGEWLPDQGKIHRQLPVSSWGMLEQTPHVEEKWTLLDFVQAGSVKHYHLLLKLQDAEQALSEADANQLEKSLAHYAQCQEAYQMVQGYEWEQEVDETLNRLGLPKNRYPIPYVHLSGGEKTRAQLARMMIHRPDFILLDEPTNHLDLSMMNGLVEWLNNYKGAVLLVSHDRWLIDQTVDAVVELTQDGTRRYKGGYSSYRRERDREESEQRSLYKKQVREQKKLEESIQRYRTWFNRAHQAAGERNPFYKKKANKNQTRFRAKEEALKRLKQEMTEAPHKEATLRMDLSGGKFSPRTLLRTKEMALSFGKEPKFKLHPLTFALQRGERWGVVGANGSGKTTLLRLLIGELQPSAGEVLIHPEVTMGYFAQELENLDPEGTVLESLLSLPGMTVVEARNLLASFLFPGDAVHRRINELSMGEKCRVAFLHLYFSGADLIVLDEPTNYLDIVTREKIEEALLHFPGSMILVSHDRQLIEGVTNRTLILDQGRVETFAGSYEEYREHRREKESYPSQSDRANRIRSLEWQLIQLMTATEASDIATEDEVLLKIKEVQHELHRLRRDE